MPTIKVQDAEVTVISVSEQDYISLTDMVRNIENGSALIEKWLRNKNTIEFIGIWEQMYNPNFNSPEFEGFGKTENPPGGGFGDVGLGLPKHLSISSSQGAPDEPYPAQSHTGRKP